MKYITLPSGKIINNVDNISTVTLLETRTDEHSLPLRTWIEFDVIYKDGKHIELTYESLNSAAQDRDTLREVIGAGPKAATRIF